MVDLPQVTTRDGEIGSDRTMLGVLALLALSAAAAGMGLAFASGVVAVTLRRGRPGTRSERSP